MIVHCKTQDLLSWRLSLFLDNSPPRFQIHERVLRPSDSPSSPTVMPRTSSSRNSSNVAFQDSDLSKCSARETNAMPSDRQCCLRPLILCNYRSHRPSVRLTALKFSILQQDRIRASSDLPPSSRRAPAMPGKPWTTKEQAEFLAKCMSRYLDAQVIYRVLAASVL